MKTYTIYNALNDAKKDIKNLRIDNTYLCRDLCSIYRNNNDNVKKDCKYLLTEMIKNSIDKTVKIKENDNYITKIYCADIIRHGSGCSEQKSIENAIHNIFNYLILAY